MAGAVNPHDLSAMSAQVSVSARSCPGMRAGINGLAVSPSSVQKSNDPPKRVVEPKRKTRRSGSF
jgi:hypothetical protein